MDGLGLAACAVLVLLAWSFGNSRAAWEIGAHAATPGASRSRLLAPAILTWLWIPVMALAVWFDLSNIEVAAFGLMIVSGLNPPVCTVFVVAEWLHRRREDRVLGRSLR